MNYLNFNLDGIDAKELSTKLSFDIATARNSGFPLAKFTFKNEAGEKFQKSVATRLREIKKQGRITFFVSSLDFASQSTEVEYLFNKFPEIKSEKENVFFKIFAAPFIKEKNFFYLKRYQFFLMLSSIIKISTAIVHFAELKL